MIDGDTHLAIEALKQAVRWNPMACEHRLNLAELCRDVGDISEYLALSHSVLIRASEPSHLIRAFLSFAEYFQASGKSREVIKIENLRLTVNKRKHYHTVAVLKLSMLIKPV